MSTPENLDQVKAGRYELVATSWRETTSKLGEPYDYVDHVQGDVVTLAVDEARRLVAAGAVVKPGERERTAVEAAKAHLSALIAGLPEEVRAQVSADLAPPTPEPSVAPKGPPASATPPSPAPIPPRGPSRAPSA